MNRKTRELFVFGALAILLAVLAVFAPAFYQPQPLLSRISEQMPVVLAVIGVSLIIIVRQIDISIGSQFGVCAVLGGSLIAARTPLPLAAVAMLLAGAAMGAVNGALTAWLGLPSIVVTLATMVTLAEALRMEQQGRFINLPPGIQWFGFGQTTGQLALVGATMALLAAAAWCMRRVAAGRMLYAVGSDPEAARLASINPRTATFLTFLTAGALTGLGALFNLVRSPQVDPKAGLNLELQAIAAAVVGGIAITGGRGSLWGAFGGLMLLATIGPALTYLHVEAYWDRALQGAIILLAVSADGLRRKLAKRSKR